MKNLADSRRTSQTIIHVLSAALVRGAFIALQLLIVRPSAFANDSIGSVAARGITFIKSENVRLLQEEL